MPVTNIGNLPNNTLKFDIFNRLSDSDLKAVSCADKKLHSLSSSNEVWKPRFFKSCEQLVVCPNKYKDETNSFKEAYKALFQDIFNAIKFDRLETVLSPEVIETSGLQEFISNNFEFMLYLVQRDGLALQIASPDLQNNKTLVLAAVLQNPNAILYASPKLQTDRDVVLSAVKQNGLCLTSVAPLLGSEQLNYLKKYDPERYLKETSCAVQAIKDDKEIILAAIDHDEKLLFHASERLQNDPEVVIAALSAMLTKDTVNRLVILAYPEINNVFKFMLTAVSFCGMALEHASPELQDNKELVLAAVKQNGDAIKFASPCLQNDRDVDGLARN